MRTPEDPCRDPASEARDDHASEPRATPETNAAVQRIRSDMRILQGDEMDELTDVCQRLERQRDGLLEVIANSLHDPSISAKSKRPLANAFQNVKGGADV